MTDNSFELKVKMKAKKKADFIVDQTFLRAYFPEHHEERIAKLLKEHIETAIKDVAAEMLDEMKAYVTEG